MIKKIIIYFFLLNLFLSFPFVVRAEYVLPYPPVMPGNKMYRVGRIIDRLKQYWFFGNLAQLKYRRSLSDKYLVESKTLFEYKQYLLASDALVRSDSQVGYIKDLIHNAKNSGVDIADYSRTVKEQMSVHISVLERMKSLLPEEFVWRPEKVQSTNLQIGSMIDTSISLRKKIYNEFNSQ